MAATSSTPEPPFTVSVAPAEGGAIGLRLEGELDLGGVAAFDAATAELASDALAEVDLRELAFMDSSGVAALIKLDLRLREGGGSVRCVVAPDGPVRKLVDLTQLGEMLEVVEAPAGSTGTDPESGVDPGGEG
jgi:anti-anti-sigma factor